MARPTLVQSFVAALGAVTLLLLALAALVLDGSRRSILASAERLRAAEAESIEAQVRQQLDGAQAAVDEIRRELSQGLRPEDVEPALFRELQRNPLLAEVSLVHAVRTGFAEDGTPLLAARDRWQLSVFRDGEAIHTRRVAGGLSELRTRPLRGDFAREASAGDPTAHLTFLSSAARDTAGAAIWTDLTWSQLDAGLPEDRRRVVVSVQQAALDGGGELVGVVRVALLASALDEIVDLRMGPDDPRRIFLADADGRLITRLSARDRLQRSGDALRIAPSAVPEPVALALSGPLLSQSEAQERTGEIAVAGERWLATFRALAGSQGWFAGIVVPETAYTRELHAMRWRLLAGCAAIIALVMLGGGIALLALRRGLGRIRKSALRMRNLEFAEVPPEATFRDVEDVLAGMEQAKTALRGMGKYAPLDLVRELYASNREPRLGGELRELSILFTDLEGFTTVSERLSPDDLARALGLYFEAMTASVRGHGGTVDKFIGDAVMALWNAPRRRQGHARLACATILACQEATDRLYRSDAWRGLPPLRTRFGLHKAEVMVGHFGAADRFSYTALGDGVNLASRLEGLCKQYEVEAIVSQAVVDEAGAAFAFRRLDRVAVKGRVEGLMVYELLGAAADLAAARDYELAFDDYLRGDFAATIARLELYPGDGPSRVLARRCGELLLHPPPATWNGVHVAASK